MMDTSTNPRILTIAAAVALGVLSGCGDSGDALDDAETTAESVLDDGAITDEETDEIVDDAAEVADATSIEDLQSAVGDEDLATLFDVLDVVGFDDIAEAESFTFFAPNDGAFTAIDADLLSDLLADPDALRDILQDHLVEDVVFAADIPADGTVTTTGGLELTFDLSGDQPTVNGIPIVATDYAVEDRGVIHVIDGLLLEN